MLKYGIYVSKKANEIVQSIENKEQIDNAKIDSYILQFSGYLERLTTLSNGTDTLPPQPDLIPQQTGDTQTSGNDASGMIQDINRDAGSGQTTP